MALDDVAFLSRSEHRAEVLEKLERDDWTRRDLRDETGISQPTLFESVEDSSERGWATEHRTENGREYTLTPLGALLSEEFSTLLETIEAIRALRDVADHLPLDDVGFDLSLLTEASITTAQPDDTLAHMRRQDALIERSDHVRTLCSSFAPGAIRTQHDRVLNGDYTGEAIVSGDALDTLTAQDELAELLSDLIASERPTFYRYDGSIPAMLSQFDESVGIVPLDDEGMPCGAFIESDDEEIRAWVTDTLDACRERATEITVDDLLV
jgi:predicted transcriptional regulator